MGDRTTQGSFFAGDPSLESLVRQCVEEIGQRGIGCLPLSPAERDELVADMLADMRSLGAYALQRAESHVWSFMVGRAGVIPPWFLDVEEHRIIGGEFPVVPGTRLTTSRVIHHVRRSERQRDADQEPRWGTPQQTVRVARDLLGRGEDWGREEAAPLTGAPISMGVDFDPSSDSHFNKTVMARLYYSMDDRGEDALTLPWHDNAMVNPPGGLVREFWRKLIAEIMVGNVKRAVWIGFSLDQLGSMADERPGPLDFATCILRKRIKFVRRDGYSASPSHHNYITAIGVDVGRARSVLEPLGAMVVGRLAGKTGLL